MILSTISYLIHKKEFHPESSIKNIGLVLGLFLMFAFDVQNVLDDEDWKSWDAWKGRIVGLAKKYKIQIKGKGPYGVEQVFQAVEAGIKDNHFYDNGGVPELAVKTEKSNSKKKQEEGSGSEPESEPIDEDQEEAPDGFRRWRKWDWKNEVGKIPLAKWMKANHMFST
jgi:hypothetical protein